MLRSYLQRFNNYIFKAPGKVPTNIHHSLTNKNVLLAVRIIIFLLMSTRYVYQIHKYYLSFFNGLMYLTEYSFFLTWLYFALVILDYLINEKSNKKYSPKLKEYIQIIYQVAMCLQFPVVVLFWIILYDYSRPQHGITFLLQISIHGLPLVYLLIDLIFNVIQFQKRHFLVVLVFGTFYLIINLGYSLTINPVYKPINWVTVMSYVWVSACLVLSFIVHNSIRLFWQKYRKPILSNPLTEQLDMQKSLVEDGSSDIGN